MPRTRHMPHSKPWSLPELAGLCFVAGSLVAASVAMEFALLP